MNPGACILDAFGHVAWVRSIGQRPDFAQRIKIALSAQVHLNFKVQFDKNSPLTPFLRRRFPAACEAKNEFLVGSRGWAGDPLKALLRMVQHLR